MISFSRVATDELQERIHKIRQQNPTWGSFEEALREAYDYERSKGRDRREFDEWVALEKTHQSATQAFLEFKHRFARLSEREQRLVGMDKVLMFVRLSDKKKGWTSGSNSKMMTVQMAFPRIGLKSKEYAEDMIRGR